MTHTIRKGVKSLETTININIDILNKIVRASRMGEISCSELIVLLIKKAMNDINNPARIGRLVRYQERRKADEWHALHVQLRMDDYEYLLDLRKLLKMSVSLILACAVKKYLDKMTSCNLTDNYQHKNYIVIRELIDGIISWRFIWGFPHSIDKLLNKQTE